MSITPKALINSKSASTADTTEYTAPAGTRAIIDKFTATNTNGAAQTLTVNIVPSGGPGPAAANRIVDAVSIPANSAYDATEMKNQILNPGDSVSVKASSIDVTIRMSGREVTS